MDITFTLDQIMLKNSLAFMALKLTVGCVALFFVLSFVIPMFAKIHTAFTSFGV